MLLPRRNHALLQRSERTRTHFRCARTLGTALLVAGLSLSACGPAAQDDQDRSDTNAAEAAEERTVIVTGVFGTPAPVRNLVFLPTEDSPWTGLIATSLLEGGFDIFSVEGERVISTAGPQLMSIAGASDFALRGERFPLLFGVDELGALRGFAVVTQAEDVIELPLEGDSPTEGVAAVCHFDTGIGYVDMAILGTGSQAAIVRVRDTGSAGLTVTEEARLDLPFAARSCAGVDGDLLVAGPTGGLARINQDGITQAFESVLGISDIGHASLLGRSTIIAVASDTAELHLYDARTLQRFANVETEDGLNAARFDTPTALAVTTQSYGGMSFSSGLIGVYDRADSRVKLIARETLARAVVSPES